MSNDPLSVSVVINAPIERMWALLIEPQQSNRQDPMEQKYFPFQVEPEGPPVEGQVVQGKAGCIHLTIRVDHIERPSPPIEGQTTSATITFLGKAGTISGHWFRDTEHYHFQEQLNMKHPWFTLTQYTDIRCVAIDDNSCVVIRKEQLSQTVRLIPRWLAQRLDNDMKGTTIKVIETSLQKMKLQAEHDATKDATL